MKLLVCGGRFYGDAARVEAVLSAFHAERLIDLVIEGGAHGADRLARVWAQRKGIHVATVEALWQVYGRQRAGPIRNAAMLILQPDVVLAFPGNNGTADMKNQARRRGIEVIEVDHV